MKQRKTHEDYLFNFPTFFIILRAYIFSQFYKNNEALVQVEFKKMLKTRNGSGESKVHANTIDVHRNNEKAIFIPFLTRIFNENERNFYVSTKKFNMNFVDKYWFTHCKREREKGMEI